MVRTVDQAVTLTLQCSKVPVCRPKDRAEYGSVIDLLQNKNPIREFNRDCKVTEKANRKRSSIWNEPVGMNKKGSFSSPETASASHEPSSPGYIVNLLLGILLFVVLIAVMDIWVLQAVWIVDVTLVKTQEKQAGSGISRYLKLRVARILLKYLAIVCRCRLVEDWQLSELPIVQETWLMNMELDDSSAGTGIHQNCLANNMTLANPGLMFSFSLASYHRRILSYKFQDGFDTEFAGSLIVGPDECHCEGLTSQGSSAVDSWNLNPGSVGSLSYRHRPIKGSV
ncbi:hypothetical protein CK203_076570 [Vitis vinifera]|uniref:Uncharacterized protein n=1 Tax=Vitis vinifera TaxID=29760 RepID=A0A438DB52_VITVI|nr:hypothetical protein CK203_076570 [Vitis vinifera]